jgi:hypothetical protein
MCLPLLIFVVPPRRPQRFQFNAPADRARQESARGKTRASKNIERHVLSLYGATRLPSEEHQLKLRYRTDQDLDDLIDDLPFEISGAS